MTFEQALAAMRDGKKVRRKKWSSENYYYMMDNKIKSTDKGNGDSVDGIAVLSIFADDWEIYELTESKEDSALKPICTISLNIDNREIASRVFEHLRQAELHKRIAELKTENAKLKEGLRKAKEKAKDLEGYVRAQKSQTDFHLKQLRGIIEYFYGET